MLCSSLCRRQILEQLCYAGIMQYDWLNKFNVTFNSLSECFISAQHCQYATLKFVYDIGSQFYTCFHIDHSADLLCRWKKSTVGMYSQSTPSESRKVSACLQNQGLYQRPSTFSFLSSSHLSTNMPLMMMPSMRTSTSQHKKFPKLGMPQFPLGLF